MMTPLWKELVAVNRLAQIVAQGDVKTVTLWHLSIRTILEQFGTYCSPARLELAFPLQPGFPCEGRTCSPLKFLTDDTLELCLP
jgi:hypothetical protein